MYKKFFPSIIGVILLDYMAKNIFQQRLVEAKNLHECEQLVCFLIFFFVFLSLY